MKRFLVGAAVLALSVVGADISAVSYISGSAGIVVFAQESRGSSAATGTSAAGFGNGGAALGSGAQPAGGTPASGTAAPAAGDAASSAATDSPDAAAKVGAKPVDAKATDTKAADAKSSGKAAKTTDTEAAPEAPAVATTLATTTSGDPEAIGTPKVDLPKSSGNGNLGYSIGIDVPAFHGVEPQIALNYNSSRKSKLGGLYQGWLGYGWGLDGLDVIERATPGYGMPAYDANDIYLLDGQAVVACVAGMVSPSCATGGTHATENESYRRVALNSSTNEWKVTDRDGTVSTFRSVAAVANLTPTAGTPAYDLAMSYRWLLTSVTDTNGNSVSYSYTCPASPVCYPDSVSYNGTIVKFYYETRPDLILMGNGRDISLTSQRIKTIGITVSGAVRGAYKLTYDQAPFSNASRLTAVTRHGTDATVAADGTISGGTAKVLGQMTYQNTDGIYGAVPASLVGALGNVSSPREVGDLDFDGRDEIFGDYIQRVNTCTHNQGPCPSLQRTKYIYKFNSNGAQSATISLPLDTLRGWNTDPNPPEYFSQSGRFLASKNTMDFADSAIQPYVNGATGQVTYTATKSIIKTDASLGLTKSTCVPAGYQAICDALPTGTEPENRAIAADAVGGGVDTLNVNGSSSRLKGIGDFLGNGRQEPIYWGSGGTIKKGVLSNGSWQSSGASFSISCPNTEYSGLGTCAFADINGDGATDIFIYNGTNGNSNLYLSTGAGFKTYLVSSMAGVSAVLRDFDNDGRMDVITVGGTLTSQSYRTGTVRAFSLRPSRAES
ncbi:FG-GAP-like repeat-containing protein [Mesorhizobium sp. M0047]|uniref:FG-GAP-like repeat-containing protein n=1 Tax=Mesorhizobium sp. M0047 TaxID=2956859 RepID=UPI00333D519D